MRYQNLTFNIHRLNMKKITSICLFLLAGAVHSQMLTQSVSQDLMEDNSAACVDFTLGIRDNTFYRAFPLSDFSISGDYLLTAVEFGVEQLTTNEPGGFPVTVSVYSTTGTFPANWPDSYNLVATQTIFLFDETLTMHTVPLSATIPAGSTIVAAVAVPLTDATFFQIGSNNEGQLAPGYITAEACGLLTPLNLASAGFPNMHMVMNIQGTEQLSIHLNENALFQIVPNPADGIVNFRLNDGIEITDATVSDMTGKSFKLNVSENSAEVSQLPPGIYLLKLRTNAGVFTGKLVKK